MPNCSPIIRSMKWHTIKETILPTEISRILPDGDPMRNKREIEEELKSIEILGPEVKSITEEYVSGKITHSEFQNKIDKTCDNIDPSELNQYQYYVRQIRKELLCFHGWKELIPLMDSYNISDNKIKEYSKEIQRIELYHSA